MFVHPALFAAPSAIAPKPKLPARLDRSISYATAEEINSTLHEDAIAIASGLRNSFKKLAWRRRIQHLVGVDSQEPAALRNKGGNSEIQLSRIVYPRVTNYLGTKLLGYLDRPIIRSTINDGDAFNLTFAALDAAGYVNRLVQSKNNDVNPHSCLAFIAHVRFDHL